MKLGQAGGDWGGWMCWLLYIMWGIIEEAVRKQAHKNCHQPSRGHLSEEAAETSAVSEL